MNLFQNLTNNPSNPNMNDNRATVMAYNSDDSHPTITSSARTVHGPRASRVSHPAPCTNDQTLDGPLRIFQVSRLLRHPKNFYHLSRLHVIHWRLWLPLMTLHLHPISLQSSSLKAFDCTGIDYRPVKGVRRPMASWYRTVSSRPKSRGAS